MGPRCENTKSYEKGIMQITNLFILNTFGPDYQKKQLKILVNQNAALLSEISCCRFKCL